MIIGLEAMTVADFVSREWLSWAGAARGCAVHCKPWAWAQGGEGFPAVVTFGKQSQWKSHPVLSFGEMLVMVRSCEASKSSSSHFPLHYCNKTDSSPWLSPSTFNYLSFTENFSSMWRLKWTRLFLSVVSQYCCAYALAKSYIQCFGKILHARLNSSRGWTNPSAFWVRIMKDEVSLFYQGLHLSLCDDDFKNFVRFGFPRQ